MLAAKGKPGHMAGTALIKACEGQVSRLRGKEWPFPIPRDHPPVPFRDKGRVSLDMMELIPPKSIQNFQLVLGLIALGLNRLTNCDPRWLI